MRRTLAITILAITAASGCSRSTPEQRMVNEAAAALGGRERVLAVTTLVVEGSGAQGNLGQDVTPDSTAQSFLIAAYRRAIDLTGERSRTELTRSPAFRYFAGQAPQRQIAGVDGAAAYNVGADDRATRVPDQIASDRRVEIYHHPLTSIRAALSEGATLGALRTEDGQALLDVRTAGGVAFTVAIDSATKLPVRVLSTTDNPNLGDVVIETTFADYEDVDGLQLPSTLTTTTDGVMTTGLGGVTHTINGQTGDLAVPAAAASAPPVAGPPPANVTVQPLASGIWYLAGQSHHSVLVEFADHLTLIEAPLSESRALAVIAKARELVPGKPLTQVVMSHHHFDHSAGVRAAMSEGLTVIAHSAAAAYIEAAGKRPHTVVPDALARSPRPVTVEAVDGERVITDGSMTVTLYPIVGSAHAGTMLMAYFPRERILVEADLFTPGAAVAQFAAELSDNITTRQLRVERIAPLHGAVAPFSDLVRTVQAMAVPAAGE